MNTIPNHHATIQAIAAALPGELHSHATEAATFLTGLAAGQIDMPIAEACLAANPALVNALRTLAGNRFAMGDIFVSDGVDTQQIVVVTGGSVGDVIGRQIVIALPPLTSALHHLRAPVGDFMGREAEVQRLIAHLRTAVDDGATAAISGLRGMGGLGKTELAYRVATELRALFPDAQLLVELRGASASPLTPEQALQTLIRAFEREAKLPDDLAELRSLYCAKLTGRHVLILADDARDAAQVRPLLPPSGCALLVTSRSRFSLPGMLVLDLEGLSPADAGALLLAICPRIGEEAAELTRLCGYLPLALRISASLLANGTRSVPHYLEQLRQARLAVLADPDTPDDPAASVEASLSLSYDTLTSTAQATLCQISVFNAGFDLAAVQAVVETDGEVEEQLDLLHRRSLLEWDAHLNRYSLHDLVRVFGASRLGNETAVNARYAKHYLAVLQEANNLYRSGGDCSLKGLELFDQERPHIEQGWSWLIQRMRVEPSAVIDDMFVGYRFASRSLYPLRYPPSVTLAELELQAARRIGNCYAESIALSDLADWHRDHEDHASAIILYEQSLAVARLVRYRLGESIVMGKLALMYKFQGDYLRAKAFLQRSLTIIRQKLDDPRYQRSAVAQLLELGGVNWTMEDSASAALSYKEALELANSIGHLYGVCRALNALGSIAFDDEQYNQAIKYYEQMLAVARNLKDWEQVTSALTDIGDAYAATGNLVRALDSYHQALDSAHTQGNVRVIAVASGNLALAYEGVGDLVQAVAFLEPYVDFVRSAGSPTAAQDTTRLAELRARLHAHRSDGKP